MILLYNVYFRNKFVEWFMWRTQPFLIIMGKIHRALDNQDREHARWGNANRIETTGLDIIQDFIAVDAFHMSFYIDYVNKMIYNDILRSS